jgi:hypothetical protein
VALGILVVSEGLVPVILGRLSESGPALRAAARAWYPVARVSIGFNTARIEFGPGAGTFHAELLGSGPFSGFTGLWRARRAWS